MRAIHLVIPALLALALPAEAADLSKRLPDGGTARIGSGDIRAAWYVGPTERYGHAVLGDGIEAAGLAVRDRTGTVHVVELDASAVFEDITPRLADLDGDGRNEVVTVKSTQTGGGALALYGLRGGTLEEAASIAPIGRRNRWLNPAGIADFTGDGRLEVALVKTPHIGGTLEIWSFDGRSLRRVGAARGFSNHAIGSRALGLSAVADVNGDGRLDLILPNDGRRRLMAVTVNNGTVGVIAMADAGGAIVSDLEASGAPGAIAVRYRVAGGAAKSVTIVP